MSTKHGRLCLTLHDQHPTVIEVNGKKIFILSNGHNGNRSKITVTTDEDVVVKNYTRVLKENEKVSQ